MQIKLPWVGSPPPLSSASNSCPSRSLTSFGRTPLHLTETIHTTINLASFLSDPVVSQLSVQVSVLRLSLLLPGPLSGFSFDSCLVCWLVSFNKSLLERLLRVLIGVVGGVLPGTVVLPALLIAISGCPVAPSLPVLELHIWSLNEYIQT
jgi:hypothetical protein